MAKEMVFLLTHHLNPTIIKNIHKIHQERGARDFCVLIHGELETADLQVSVQHFSMEQIENQGYKMLQDDMMFSSVHLSLLYFFKKFPDYEKYWFLEYDVEFGGNWKDLFDAYLDCSADFISSYIQRYNHECKHWYWWKLEHPTQRIPISERIRSFNPIYRISQRALKFLIEELKTGWEGHHEVLLPTLLHTNQFELLDFGRGGEFYSSEYPVLYRKSARFPSENFRFLQLGSLRYRPAMKKAGFKNLIYHPVKMETGLSRREEMRFQFSLFKKKVRSFLNI